MRALACKLARLARGTLAIADAADGALGNARASEKGRDRGGQSSDGRRTRNFRSNKGARAKAKVHSTIIRPRESAAATDRVRVLRVTMGHRPQQRARPIRRRRRSASCRIQRGRQCTSAAARARGSAPRSPKARAGVASSSRVRARTDRTPIGGALLPSASAVARRHRHGKQSKARKRRLGRHG